MAHIFEVTAGWTKEIGPFTLSIGGSPVDLTGFPTPELVLISSGGAELELEGTVRVDDDQVGNRGKVYFKPDAADFVADGEPYQMRWRVIDSAGDVVTFPNGVAETVMVRA